MGALPASASPSRKHSMKSHDDEVVPADVRAESREPAAILPSRLLNRVREALFEPTRATTSQAIAPQRVDNAEHELSASTQSMLRELVSRELGPALSEFNLQLDAIRELVPDKA